MTNKITAFLTILLVHSNSSSRNSCASQVVINPDTWNRDRKACLEKLPRIDPVIGAKMERKHFTLLYTPHYHNPT
jgi:hypothetical protein